MFYRYRKQFRRTINKLFYSVDESAFAAALRQIGLKPGDAVCVHSELSQIGHLEGGPRMLVESLLKAVGEKGCVLMPSYPTNGSSLKYCESGEVFDVRTSPSKVGALTEVFRSMAGVRRSLHATNSIAGWGERAEHFLRGHELSPTPFGRETPYGRLAEADDAYVLMIGVPILSLLHHLQERVDFPNLYLPDAYEASFVDYTGAVQTHQTRFILPRIPYFVAVPPASGSTPDWAILHDFALIYPQQRARQVRARGYRFPGYPQLFERCAELERRGILSTARLGRTEIGLLNARDYVQYIEPEFSELIERYRDHYDPDAIRALDLPYF